MVPHRFLGVFINPLYVQNEGLQQVFDNIERAGARAICLSPFVAWPAEDGRRFPPLHVDGYERLVARPVWGKREIRLARFLAYEPDLHLYEGTPYRPVVRAVPPEVDAAIPHEMLAEAKRRGMEAHVMFGPFLPPGVRTEDRPVVVDGSVPPPPRVALSACLNAPAARAYALALAEDIARHFPDADGLIPDWAEYGAYHFDDHFACFCPHCERQARAQGLDWDAMRRDVTALWDWCHALTPRELDRSRRVLRNPSELVELFIHHPGWLAFWRFKAQTVAGFYRELRKLLDERGFGEMALTVRGWPPPWNRSSGLDYRALSALCGVDVIAPKLFTFDYSAMPRWYGQTLLAWNPDLAESELLDALVEWMNLPDDLEPRSFADYHIPAPGESHPARITAYRTRIDEAVAQVGGRARCCPIAHAYLPEPQWKRMLAVLRDSRVDGLWAHMYGYLSDRKFEILKDVWT